MSDRTRALLKQVQEAYADGTALRIVGGGSKSFLGRVCDGEVIATTDHRGIINYQPKELVITARAGTPLREIQAILAEQQQELPFEPPLFSEASTIGGVVAAGLSGPARPFRGAVRDHLLGVHLINGQGQRLKFGGEVMKNVAGYDLSRLMCGAFGTLGLLLDVSLKVMPIPEREESRVFAYSAETGLRRVREWQHKGLPITAVTHLENRLHVRFSSTGEAVTQALETVGGEALEDDGFWRTIRDLAHPTFQGAGPLWRLSVPARTPLDLLPEAQVIDWAGAQRWYPGVLDVESIRQSAAGVGGHFTLFRGGAEGVSPWQPLLPGLRSLHQRIKSALDPKGVFNPGRLYAQW